MSSAMVALKTGETMAETEMEVAVAAVAVATKATTLEADTSQEVAVVDTKEGEV